MSRTRSSEPLLVRVDPDTRQRLDVIATSSDRTLSQLVRYATLWWTSDPNRVCPISEVASGGKAGFINVRFARDDMDTVREVSAQMGLERGAVIRCALRAWLDRGDFTALGDPRRVTTEPQQPVAV